MPDSLLVDVAKRNTGESLKASGDRDRLFSPSTVQGIHRPLAGDRVHTLSVLALSFPSLARDRRSCPQVVSAP